MPIGDVAGRVGDGWLLLRFWPVFARRLTSSSSLLSTQERVEEERYIRKIEHDAYLRRKEKEESHKAEMEKSAAEAEFTKAMDASIEELFGVLAKTGDKISDMGIENIARWKLGKED